MERSTGYLALLLIGGCGITPGTSVGWPVPTPPPVPAELGEACAELGLSDAEITDTLAGMELGRNIGVDIEELTDILAGECAVMPAPQVCVTCLTAIANEAYNR